VQVEIRDDGGPGTHLLLGSGDAVERRSRESEHVAGVAEEVAELTAVRAAVAEVAAVGVVLGGLGVTDV